MRLYPLTRGAIRVLHRKTQLLSFTCLICFTCLLLANCSNQEENITIAAILPLTGPASQHVVIAEAIDLAVEEINASGGINGRNLEIIYADNKTNREEAKRLFLEIEEEHQPLLYITTTSGISIALSSLAEEHNVVLTGLMATDSSFIENKKWSFKYYPTSEEEMAPILRIARELDIRTLGILYQDDAFGKTHYNTLSQAFTEQGGTVVAEKYAIKNSDFSPMIENLFDTDAIYVTGFVRITKNIFNKLKEKQFNGYIFSHSGTSSQQLAGDDFQDVYVPAPIIYNPNYPFARDAKERYESKYDKVYTHQAACGYDLIKLVAGLLEENKISRATMRDLLEGEFSYPGILGYYEKSEGDHTISFPLYPAKISNGEMQYLH